MKRTIVDLIEEILRIDEMKKQWKEVFQYWMGKEIIQTKKYLEDISDKTNEDIVSYYKNIKKVESIIYGSDEIVSRFEITILIERSQRFRNYLMNKYPEAQRKTISPFKVKPNKLTEELENYDQLKMKLAIEMLRYSDILTEKELQEIDGFVNNDENYKNRKTTVLKEKEDFHIKLEDIKNEEFKKAERDLLDKLKEY